MKLLNKSIRTYILYAAIILLIAIPVLYFVIQRVVSENVDESLTFQKEKIIRNFKRINQAAPPGNLEIFEPDILFIPLESANNKKDSFYTITSFDTISNEEIPYRIMESSILLKDKAYTIHIKNSLLDNEDLIESIVTVVAIILLLIVAGLVLINRILSNRLWKPFYKTIEKLNVFKIEENNALHFQKTDVTEFTTLNNAITTLSTRNREVYQSQKEFTENASHEMQTPLAIFQGKLDLLMQTKPLSQEQYELISDLTDVNQKMSRLNKCLLLLAKIENNQFSDTENISVKSVLGKVIDQYRFQAKQRNITIRNEYTADVIIKANKTLIEIMLANLLSNAIKHNVVNGTVVIEGSGTAISFKNSSAAAQLNSDKMFQRFQKQTTDSNSTGLGLQIVKKVAAHYHFGISYNFFEQQHIFTLNIN